MHPLLARGATQCLLALSLLTACSSQPRTTSVDAQPAVQEPLIYIAANDTPTGFRAAAEAATRLALPEATLTFDPADAAVAQLRIDLGLAYRNLSESEFESIWRTTTFLMLTLYPSTCNHRSYDLSATVSGPSGVSRDYGASDSTVAWIWLLQGQNCGEAPTSEEVNSVTRRMLASIFRDMRRDDALDAVARGLVGPEGPLVNIRSNRAGAVIDQVARVERPFLRWVLDAPAGQADYELNLHFEVEEGHFSLGRGLLAIGTAGLSTVGSGLCTGSHVSLDAYLTAPRLPRTQAYHLTDAVATRMGTPAQGPASCEKIDEQTRPDVFARLVRRLFESAARDRLAAEPALAASTSPLPPILRIEAARGQGPLREAILKAKPFPRYFFGDGPGVVAPDYVLKIDLTMSGGDRKKMTAMQGFGIGLGMTTPCEPTVFTLSAHLVDGAGVPLRQYELTRAFPREGGIGGLSCQDDEHTNPDAVLALADELFARMRQDGSAALLAAARP